MGQSGVPVLITSLSYTTTTATTTNHYLLSKRDKKEIHKMQSAITRNAARHSVSKQARTRTHTIATPLSANEMHCLELKGVRAHNLSFGNSVQSLGVIRGITSFISARRGGRHEAITRLVKDGRLSAFDRMVREAKGAGSDGVIGVSANIGALSQLVEFTSYGAGVAQVDKREEEVGDNFFSATCSGEQYHCLREAGFSPRSVVFGNDAYSAGVLGLLQGSIRTALVSGEVPSFSNVFNTARANALARLREDAFSKGCNFVSGVRMHSVRLPFVQEVSFFGTACVHPNLPPPASADDVFTSALPEEELWSLVAIGRRPLSLLTGCSVYNLGMGRYLMGLVQQIRGGEVTRYRELTAKARESVMEQIQKQADRLGTDEVVSVRVVISQIRPGLFFLYFFLGKKNNEAKWGRKEEGLQHKHTTGLVEFFAYGTAVKHDPTMKMSSKSLPPQVYHIPATHTTPKYNFIPK